MSDLRQNHSPLPASWVVARSAEVHVDHVVVAPGGVFTVRVIPCAGKGVWARGATLSANGRTLPYVTEACAAAQAVSKRLSAEVGMPVEVVAILAFVSPASISAPQPIGDPTTEVRVVRADELREAMTGPRRFTPDEMHRIGAAARAEEPEAEHGARDHGERRGVSGAIAFMRSRYGRGAAWSTRAR